MRAIVLGSGLNGFSEYFEVLDSVSYRSVLDISFEELEGHDRKFVWCKFEEEIFLIISGKLHFYEGHDYVKMIAPIRYAITEFGVEEIVVTSASGGLGKEIKNGDWTLVNDVVSIPKVNINEDSSYACDFSVRKTTFQKANFEKLPNVIYAYHQGPSLGTNAEYKMLHSMGADLVGMSMYAEFRFLKALDITSYFISLPVCNYYPFDRFEEPPFEEVLDISSAALPRLVDIFKNYLKTN
jgi:purine-nucleoside phosphorylase